jgi:hypothetical protein
MPKTFISYRRNDSAEVTKRLHDRLEIQFGPQSVFMDIDSIPPGVDFRKRLSDAVQQTDVLLAVIGDGWLDASYQDGPKRGKRRLEDPEDYVRIEVEAALALGIPVIPVLVGEASMPAEATLPGEELKELHYKNAAEVRLGPSFNASVDRLIRGLEDLVRDKQELWDGLHRARDVAARDPESGLNCARKLLQRVVREVYERRIKEPAGTRSLEKIVERLIKEWYLPEHIELDAMISQAGTGNRTGEVTATDADRALTQLTEILKWYTEVEQPDGVGQLPAPKRQREVTTTKATERCAAPRIAVVPKGLRSFDANDADFFLELLPGPRDKQGLPESIRFWKDRIESENELTFTVGVICGKSGCGKSSLVKAGLLPRLSKTVTSICVEATANETETRLLKVLKKRFPALPNDGDLKAAISALRQGHGLPTGRTGRLRPASNAHRSGRRAERAPRFWRAQGAKNRPRDPCSGAR